MPCKACYNFPNQRHNEKKTLLLYMSPNNRNVKMSNCCHCVGPKSNEVCKVFVIKSFVSNIFLIRFLQLQEKNLFKIITKSVSEKLQKDHMCKKCILLC